MTDQSNDTTSSTKTGATSLPEKMNRRSGDKNRRAYNNVPRSSSPLVFAALDLGTNNCRLLIVRKQHDGFKVIDAFSRIVRLGEGVERYGRLSDLGITRALEALSVCAEKLARYDNYRLRAIATEACRRAVNGQEFIERVRLETGLNLSIITPEDEARLAVAGCSPLTDPKAEQILVFDIGGGSTEMIWIDLRGTPPGKRKSLLMAIAPAPTWRDLSDRSRAAAAYISSWVSLPVGVATLEEKFIRIHDDRKRFEAMTQYVGALIEDHMVNHPPPTQKLLDSMQMMGTSGTITTLAGVHLELEHYSRSRVDGLWLQTNAVNRVIDRLLDLNSYERAHMPCIGEERAELILSGSAILRAIMNAWPTDKVRIADRGLREGLIYSMLEADTRRKRKRQQKNEKTPVNE